MVEDLLGDLALAIQASTVTMVPTLIASPGGDHVQGRLLAGFVERAPHHLAVDRNAPLAGLSKALREPLEAGAELLRVEQTKDAAEGVVAGQATLELEKLAKELFLLPRKNGHVDGRLPT